MVLRDPVRRAHSAFWYAYNRGWETAATFEAALERDAGLDPGAIDAHPHFLYLWQGVYAEHVRMVRRHFARDRLCVELFEDLRDDAGNVCRRFFERAGVDAAFCPRESGARNVTRLPRSPLAARLLAAFLSPHNRFRRAVRRCLPHALAARLRYTAYALNSSRGAPPGLAADTAARLYEYFEAPNRVLSDLIERDLGAWRP
jgi:hypothetical protein